MARGLRSRPRSGKEKASLQPLDQIEECRKRALSFDLVKSSQQFSSDLFVSLSRSISKERGQVNRPFFVRGVSGLPDQVDERGQMLLREIVTVNKIDTDLDPFVFFVDFQHPVEGSPDLLDRNWLPQRGEGRHVCRFKANIYVRMEWESVQGFK